MRCLILLFVVSINDLVAQGGPNEPNVIAPSPRSSEFNKYIDYKVSISNGLPEIFLSFYEIKIDGLTIPIGITYHASGIKYGQTSGDVGLGWQLTPGYRVSRTIMNRPDEFFNMLNGTAGENGQDILSHIYNLNATTPKLERDKFLSRYLKGLQPGAEVPSHISTPAEYLDGGMDIFTAGLPETNDKFVISDRVNKIITPLQSTVLKTSYVQNDDGITEFNIIDGDGIRYKFGQSVENTNLTVLYKGAYRKYNTAWMLSDLTTPFGQSVGFSYQHVTESSTGFPFSSRTLRYGAAPFPTLPPGPPCVQTIDQTAGGLGAQSGYNTFVLTGITTPQESVTLVRNIDGTVNNIVIKSKANRQIRRIDFFYTNLFGRVFLDDVHVSGSDNNAIQKYHFEYYDRDVNMLYYDCFGYYQIAPRNDYEGGQYAPKIEFNFDNIYITYISDGTATCNTSLSNAYTFGSTKRNFPTTANYTLKSITYPTGGTVQYQYQSNQYTDPGGNLTLGGGLRVTKITSNDLISGNLLERNYSYGTNNSGELLFDASKSNYYVKDRLELFVGGYATPEIYGLKKRIHSSQLNDELAGEYLQSNYGWYSKVTETYKGINSEKGTVEYTFFRPGRSAVIQQFGAIGSVEYPSYYVPYYDFWSKPYLRSKAVHVLKNGIDELKQRENYEYYEPNGEDGFLNFQVSSYSLGLNGQLDGLYGSPYVNTSLSSLFNYGSYKITRGDVLLRKKAISHFENGLEINEVSELEYTVKGNLVATERRQLNNNEVMTTHYKYPFSYSGLTGVDEITSGIKRLNELNIINQPVEQTTYKSNIDGSNSRLVSSTFSSYRNDLPLRTKGFNIENPLGTSNFVPSFVESGNIKNDVRYKEQLSYNQYDAKGNIQEWQKKNDVREVYIWGYNSKYPVAKIIGTDYNTAKTYINQSVLDNAIGGIDDTNIRNHLNNLRNIPGAIVTTYTYIPLVGISSETDSRGRTTYFEYDSFNRLMHVKDKDNNILKKFDYKYRATILQ